MKDPHSMSSKRKRDEEPTTHTSTKKKKVESIPQQVKKAVKRALAKTSELKYSETATSNTGVDNAGQILPLSDVVQGTTDSNRIGDSLKPHTLDVDISLQASSDTFNNMRVIIFKWDRNTTDTTLAPINPIPQDILMQLNQDYAPMSATNWDRSSNFRVIRDVRVCLNPTSNQSSRHRLFMNLDKYEKIDFSSATTYGIHKYYIMIISDSGAAPHPQYSYFSRFTFYDS